MNRRNAPGVLLLLLSILIATWVLVIAGSAQAEETETRDSIRFHVTEVAPLAPAWGSPTVHDGMIVFSGGLEDDREADGDDDCEDSGRSTFIYNPREDRWDDLDALPDCLGVIAATTTSTKGCVYLFGGFDPTGGDARRNIHRYDFRSGEWDVDVADFPYAIGSALSPVVPFGDLVYVFGGLGRKDDEWDVHGTTLVFDPLSYEIDDVSPMLTKRFGMHAGNGGAYRFGDQIWIVGGMDENENLLPIDVYVPGTDDWTTSRATPPTRGLTARSEDGLFLFKDDLSAAWRYCPDQDEWKRIAVEFGRPRGFKRAGAVSVVDGKFFALGEKDHHKKARWMIRGEFHESSEPSARLFISPGSSVLTSMQKFNVSFIVEGSNVTGEDVEWVKLMVDGVERTHGIALKGVRGEIIGGGVTLRFPENPKALFRRLGPGSHTLEVKARVGEQLLRSQIEWRFVETEEE